MRLPDADEQREWARILAELDRAAMEQGAFQRFFKRCSYLLATKVLGVDPSELMVETSDRRRAA